MDKNVFFFLQLSWNCSELKDGITVGTNVTFPLFKTLTYKDLKV